MTITPMLLLALSILMSCPLSSQSGKYGKPGDCIITLLVSKDDKSVNAKHRRVPLCETSTACCHWNNQSFRQCSYTECLKTPTITDTGPIVKSYTGDSDSIRFLPDYPNEDVHFWHIDVDFDLNKWSSETRQFTIPVEYEYKCDTTTCNCNCQDLCYGNMTLLVTILYIELSGDVFPTSPIDEGKPLLITCASNIEIEGWLYIKMLESGSEYHCRPGIQYPQELGDRTLTKGQRNCTLQIQNTRLSDGGYYECGAIFVNHLDEFSNLSHQYPSHEPFIVRQNTYQGYFYTAVTVAPILMVLVILLAALVVIIGAIAYRRRPERPPG